MMMAEAAMFSPEEKGHLRRLLAVPESFRSLHPEAKVRWLSEMLNGALDEGESVRTYANRMKIHYNVASVDLLALGPMLRSREPGLDLIEARPNPDDLRRHEVRLTSKGRSLISRMLRHFI